MKSLLQSAMILLATTANGHAGNSTSPTPKKIPHNHAAHKGGVVLMFGDDHAELLRDGPMVMVELTDKLREPVLSREFEIKATLLSASRNQELIVTGEETSNLVHIALGPDPHGKLELKLKRKKRPTPGYVTTERAQSIELEKLTKK